MTQLWLLAAVRRWSNEGLLPLSRRCKVVKRPSTQNADLFSPRSSPSPGSSPRSWGHQVWLDEAVEVDDDIFHFCIVDGALGGGAPGFFGAFVIGEDADDVDRFQIVEIQRHRIGDATPEHEVEFAHMRLAFARKKLRLTRRVRG